MDLVKKIYKITKKFPKDELYCLTSQVRRSAISIPSNIAEGSQRGSDKEFAHFVLITKGSLAELETQIILSEDSKYITNSTMENIILDINELQKMLYSFHIKLTANR